MHAGGAACYYKTFILYDVRSLNKYDIVLNATAKATTVATTYSPVFDKHGSRKTDELGKTNNCLQSAGLNDNRATHNMKTYK